ncbi:MAG: hypothetical protein KDB07_03660 [Planctomycetes bacterium]|nr:hypothetical protein [Planctomycetota bacterium]
MPDYLDQLSTYDSVLVALVLKNSSLNQSQVDEAVLGFLAADEDTRADLAHRFVELGLLSRTEMYRLVKARNFALLRKEDKRIARRAVRKGYISRTRINDALIFQKQLFKAIGNIKRLHEILIDDGSLSREQVNAIWAEYREYLHRRGERPAEARTDPALLKKQG